MNTSIEQKYQIGSGGKSEERLMEYVDQNNKEGRDQDMILAETCVENEAENLPIHHCWKCACSPAESEIHSSIPDFPDSSADSNCLTITETVP